MYGQGAPKRRHGWFFAAVAGVVLMVLVLVIGALANDRDSGTTAAATASARPQRTVPSGTASPSPAATTASPAPAGTRVTTKPPVKPAKVAYAKLTERQWLKIAKVPDQYAGKGYIVYGHVTQFDSATGDDSFRADVGGVRKYPSYGYVDYDTNTMLTGDATMLSNLVEDDLFRAQVVVVGSYEYETTLGGSTTVPLLLVKSIKNLGSVR